MSLPRTRLQLWGEQDFAPPDLGAGGAFCVSPNNVDLKRCSDRNLPIISTEDILIYTKDTHELELSKPAYGRVQQLFGSPIRVTGIPFVACVGEEPIPLPRRAL